MDHKERHHEHHRQEREEKKKEHAAYERRHEAGRPPIHPGWLWGSGFVLVLIAVVIWTWVVW